ncbi:CYTH domain-containing protein [Ferrimicrobium sp.]|uniref:CYTH domain-containing protein n=1 Tax=Ferrimicrobium sp. TaxID=2926050 RepID=UPI002622E030|nr:CYTH domain-containing protein [Ferrimicrobium sp.]
MARERELKRRPQDHEVGLEMVRAIIALGGQQLSHSDPEQLTSRYLDSRDHALALGQVGLRARGRQGQTPARWTIKVGALPDQRGVSEAAEFEIDGSWDVMPPVLVVALRGVGVADQLVEIARFKTLRERWVIDLSGVELEVCLDAVTVEAPQPYAFLELEVEAHERSVLDWLGDEFAHLFPTVPPSSQSKLATALMGETQYTLGLASPSQSRPELGRRLVQLLDGVDCQLPPWAARRTAHEGC